MKEYREKGKLVWVAPGALYYDLEQVEWLLPQLEDLRVGNYPPEPRNSGYVGIQQRITERAPFEIACQIAAEIDLRLDRTWPDNDLVERKYCKGLSETEIAKKVHKDEFEVYKRIRSAVSYIASGSIPRWIDTEDRRGISYREWVRSRTRYRLKAKCMRLHTRNLTNH